jgi:aspartate/glutamate racemase
MHIGMIGGIGPASAPAYYQRLSAAVGVHVTLLTDPAVGRAHLNEHKAGLSL